MLRIILFRDGCESCPSVLWNVTSLASPLIRLSVCPSTWLPFPVPYVLFRISACKQTGRSWTNLSWQDRGEFSTLKSGCMYTMHLLYNQTILPNSAQTTVKLSPVVNCALWVNRYISFNFLHSQFRQALHRRIEARRWGWQWRRRWRRSAFVGHVQTRAARRLLHRWSSEERFGKRNDAGFFIWRKKSEKMGVGLVRCTELDDP